MSEEEAKVAEIKETVAERQRRCDEDLAKAEPAVRQAEAALDTLNKVRHLFERQIQLWHLYFYSSYLICINILSNFLFMTLKHDRTE